MRELVLLATASLAIVAISQQVYSENLTTGYEYGKMVKSVVGGEGEVLLTTGILHSHYRSFYDAWEYDAHIEEFKAHVESVAVSKAIADTLEHDRKEKVCLAQAVYHEARGEPLEGQLAVANVIINRRDSDKWKDTICGVVYQPKQFSFTLYKNKRNYDDKSYQLASKVYNGEVNDNTDGSLYFFATYIKKPSWSKNMVKVKTIKNHHFYKPSHF